MGPPPDKGRNLQVFRDFDRYYKRRGYSYDGSSSHLSSDNLCSGCRSAAHRRLPRRKRLSGNEAFSPETLDTEDKGSLLLCVNYRPRFAEKINQHPSERTTTNIQSHDGKTQRFEESPSYIIESRCRLRYCVP